MRMCLLAIKRYAVVGGVGGHDAAAGPRINNSPLVGRQPDGAQLPLAVVNETLVEACSGLL